MKAGMICISVILFVQVIALATADTPISFYDPTLRHNRPVWWIQQDAPSLFYSTARIEEISKSPLFIKANEGKLETLQAVIDKQKGDGYSLADVRRLQGLRVIEKGAGVPQVASLGEAQGNEVSSPEGVVGVAGSQFSWNTARGIVGKYHQPVGLVGFLTNVFSESKNEQYRVRSTYYLSENKKETPEKVEE